MLPRSKLSDAELAACRVQYDALVSAMRELATRHSLYVANVLGECILPACAAAACFKQHHAELLPASAAGCWFFKSAHDRLNSKPCMVAALLTGGAILPWLKL